MGKTLIARGQATIHTQTDAYTLTQSLGEYVFPAAADGKIVSAVTLTSTLKVTRDDADFTGFTIGAISKPTGFSSITTDNTKKTVTYTVAANTTTLAEHGKVDIPVLISGVTYHLSFVWSKAKAGSPGAAGKPGVDANLLDWVKDWNTGKTVINGNSLITPKLFAGKKNADGTLTGVAIGRFPLTTKTAAGTVTTETVDGIYGFKDGYKTFFIDNGGNVQLGRGNQFIKYNAATGKVEFGPEVSLVWTNAIEKAKTAAIDTAAKTAQAKADAAKNAAVSTAAADATQKVNAMKIGGRNYIRNSSFTETLTGVTADGTSVSIDTSTLYNGYKTLKVVQSTACTDANASTRRTYFTAVNSKVCSPASFSMYVKASVAGNLKIRIGGSGIQTKAVTTSWQKVVLENIVPTSAVVLFGLSVAGTFWCALPMLVEGSKAVDWSPAPEDLESRVADAKKAGTDARKVADAITSKANTEGWSAKLTYIDKNGIFTGTLSANIVNALKINASQITGGTIAAARIDVNALKASLITAGNINALTLDVTKGKIGGWQIDSDSIFRGTKNNTAGAYTSASGSVTIGSNGIRGYKWRLDATGAGAIAGGNISWDAAGKVTFAASVSVAWTSSINSITTALGGSGYAKLTKIDAKGIYTGTVNASQITVGTISADRIASGSIKASKLDAASIKADIVNTGYINGLSLTFTKGKIGGWTIGSGALTGTHITLDSVNKRVVVYGANSGATSGQRVQLYYSSDTSFGFYATDKNGTCIAQLGSSNQIAGWVISSAAIRKGNVQLGSDGSITNNAKWKLNNDGSGQIASGNISWDAAGKVTFSGAVSLLWKNDIEAAKTANYGYRYYKKIVIKGESGKYYPVIFKGGEQTVKRDILIRRSYEEQAPSDWDNKSTTHKGGLILLIKTNFGNWGGIAYSWDIYELSETYSRMFAGAANCGNGCMFAVFLRGGGTTGAVYHLYSDQPIESSFMSPSPIPAAPQIAYNSDLIFQSGSTKANAPAPRTLTSAVEEEIRRHRFIKLAQGNDTTLKEHPLTYIGSTGIYTGTLTAGQVNAVNISASSIKSGTLSADRIGAGSINSSKLDAASIKANIINTGYINGLSLTFTKGKIGGWTIGNNSLTGTHIALDNANKRVVVYGTDSGVTSGKRVQLYYNNDTDFGLLATDKSGTCILRLGSSNLIAGWSISTTVIKKGNVQLGSDGSITNGTKWKLNNDGSGQIANGNISWNTSGTLTFSSSVIEKWTDAANNGKLYARGTGLNHNANRLVYLNGKSIVNTSGRGLTLTVINRSNLSLVSTKNYDVYDNDTNCNSLASALNALGSDKIVVLTSYDAISINATLNTALQRCGGSNLTVNSSRNPYVLIGIPTIGKDNGLISFYGTAASEPYAEVSTTIVNGIPQGLNVTGKQKTYIDGNGIYTGTVKASQVIIDSTLTVGGSTYNGSISVKDAGNNVKVTLNRSGITAVGGRIGGWNVTADLIEAASPTSGHRVRLRSNGYIYNDNPSNGVDYWGLKADGSAVFGTGKISFAADGSGYVANQNIKWDASGNVTIKGTVTATAGKIAGFNISGNRLVNTASDSSIEFSSMMGSASLYINSGNSLISMRADSSRTGLNIQTYANGARGIHIIANAGSKYAIESYGPMQLGQRTGERWCVPGVLYIGSKYQVGYNNYHRKIWGEGVTISSFSHIGSGKYRVYHNLRHTQYTVLAILWANQAYYGFFRLLEKTTTYFVIQNIGAKGKPDQGAFDFIIMGRNVW